jgi:hypothetical protein
MRQQFVDAASPLKHLDDRIAPQSVNSLGH